jgi:hypothetical protein
LLIGYPKSFWSILRRKFKMFLIRIFLRMML